MGTVSPEKQPGRIGNNSQGFCPVSGLGTRRLEGKREGRFRDCAAEVGMREVARGQRDQVWLVYMRRALCLQRRAAEEGKTVPRI